MKTNPGAIEELASHTQGQSIAQVAGVIKVQIDYTLDQFNLDPYSFLKKLNKAAVSCDDVALLVTGSTQAL